MDIHFPKEHPLHSLRKEILESPYRLEARTRAEGVGFIITPYVCQEKEFQPSVEAQVEHILAGTQCRLDAKEFERRLFYGFMDLDMGSDPVFDHENKNSLCTDCQLLRMTFESYKQNGFDHWTRSLAFQDETRKCFDINLKNVLSEMVESRLKRKKEKLDRQEKRIKNYVLDQMDTYYQGKQTKIMTTIFEEYGMNPDINQESYVWDPSVVHFPQVCVDNRKEPLVEPAGSLQDRSFNQCNCLDICTHMDKRLLDFVNDPFSVNITLEIRNEIAMARWRFLLAVQESFLVAQQYYTDPQRLEVYQDFLEDVQHNHLHKAFNFIGRRKRVQFMDEVGDMNLARLETFYEALWKHSKGKTSDELFAEFGVRRLMLDPVGQGGIASRAWLSMTTIPEHVTSISEMFKSHFTSFWNQISSLLHFVSRDLVDMIKQAYFKVTSLLTSILTRVIEEVKRQIGEAGMKFVKEHLVKALYCLGAYLVLRSMGIFSPQVTNPAWILYIQTQQNLNNEKLVGQSEPDFLTLMTTLCVGVIGLKSFDFVKVKDYAAQLTAVMAGGSVLSNSIKLFLVLLPPILKIALVHKYGTREQKFTRELEDWRARAQAWSSLSKVQSVMVTKRYSDEVKKCLKEGGVLLRSTDSFKLSTASKQISVAAYIRLLKIHTLLLAREVDSGSRPVPFYFHIAGPSGIGKTTCVNDVLQELGFCKEDIAYKNCSESFWTGCQGKRVIVMDEFLLGSQEDNHKIMQEILMAVSCLEWRPEFASVDDPLVGIKGTALRPDVIVTSNNTTYDRVDHKIDEAYYRRRNFVVEMKRTNRFHGVHGNSANVDFNSYTDEELRSRVWARFDVLTSAPVRKGGSNVLRKNLTYEEFKEFLIDQVLRHAEMNDRMQNLNPDMSDHREPETVMDEVLRDVYSLPCRAPSLTEAIASVFKPITVAQGPFRSNFTMDPDPILNEIAQGQGSTQVLTDEEEETFFKKYGTLTLGASAAALIALFSWMSSSATGEEMEETTYGQSDKTQKSTRPKQSSRPRFQKYTAPLSAQGPEIRSVQLEFGGSLYNAIPIKDRWVLTYAHSVNQMPVGNWKIYTAEGQMFSAELGEDDIYVDHEYDLLLLNFQSARQMPQFKDITKLFVQNEQLEKMSSCQVGLSTARGQLYVNMAKVASTPYTCVDRRVELPRAGKYYAPTEIGDCGLPVICRSGPMIGRIAGIHVAGTGAGAINPFGICSFTPREMFEEIFVTGQGPLSGPNLVQETVIDQNQYVSIPSNTKLKPSEIAEFIPWVRAKQPAILHARDPRAKGVCPIEKSLERLYAKTEVVLDEDICREVADEMFAKFNLCLDWKVGKRRLTFEEAVGGIPKWLNSLTMQTSPGYPLCKLTAKPGKTGFCWFEGQTLYFTPEFKTMVLQRVNEIDNYDGLSDIGNRFLMYVKDELVSNKKILENRTRATFANDLVSLVAFRMIYGSVFVAFQHSFDETGYAIGMNQYSEDMERMYKYLMKNCNFQRMGAGDYEMYDQRYSKTVARYCYDVFSRLGIQAGVSTAKAGEYLWKHEMEAPFQVLFKLVSVVCSNKSGCWLTTLVNCMVNEFYFRYCCKIKYPARPFSRIMNLIVLGDDNVYNVMNGCDMTPLELSRYMEVLGQKYTSAFKDREIEDNYSEFTGITFLGAIPRLDDRKIYTGALRKSTLETTPLWTRDENGTLDQVAQAMLDCCSQWDIEYFDLYCNTLRQAYNDAGRPWLLNDNYYELHNTVSRRTQESGEDFILFGQGPIVVNNKADFNSGLTQVITAEEKMPSAEFGNLMKPISEYSVSAEKEDFAYGTQSYVRRGDFTWSSTSSAGTILQQYNVPFDLLTLGNTESVQNIGFMNYEFCNPEVEVMFRVVGTPVQQGALVAWFTPFVSKAQAVSTGLALVNWTTMDHIFLTPNNNTTRTIRIPYRFFRTWLRCNYGFTNSEYESIGTLSIGVLSPLNVVSDPTSATVVIYTRFISQFAVPRPRTANGQGGSYSTISNSYTMGDVAGNVPNQTTLSSKQDVSNHLAIPMDNPPLSGGAVPTYTQYSSLSKGVGLEPTVSLQFCQTMLHREPDLLRFKDETNLQNICAKRGYLGTINITTSTNVDTEVVNFNLNSVLQNPVLANQNSVPANIAVLNQFQRWRGDIVLEFFMAKTVFHSIRLQLVIAYGYTGSLAGLDYNAFPQEIIEFTGETQWASVRIPYNACVEYLRTYEGTSTEFQADNKLGCFSIFTSTPLMVSSGVVATSVQLNYFVRFDNVELYEPRPDPFVSLRFGQQLVQLVGQGPMEASQAFASPGVDSVPETATINVDRRPGDDDEPADVAIVQQEEPRKGAPCRMKTGRKYEYLLDDILELGRRHYFVPHKTISGYTTNLFQSETSASNDYNNNANTFPLTRSISFFVYPLHPICNLFGAWSGHLKYRIVISQLQQQSSSVLSGPVQVLHLANSQSAPSQTVNQFTGTDPPTAGTANSSLYPFFSAGSTQMLVGQTSTSQTPGYAANTYLYKPDTAISSPAIEFLQYQSGNQLMIDVSVPFSATENMLPTTNGGTPPATIDNYNGTLAILLPNYSGGQGQDVRIYQAFGDDFRLHGWAPTTNSYADGVTKASFGTGTVTLPSGNVQIGYNVYQ